MYGFVTPKTLMLSRKTLAFLLNIKLVTQGLRADIFFEGHIPADVVQRFLKEKPEDVAGLAVPDMPMGSPGMDVPGRYRPYKVLKIHKDGSSTPYARVSIDGIVYLEGDP